MRRAGTPERLRLPGDNGGVALFAVEGVPVGRSLKTVPERNASDNAALRSLGHVDWAIEAGVFAEYWATSLLRTRLELRRGFNGHEGFVADLSADLVWRPSSALTLTAGPRLFLADAEFMTTCYSVTPTQAGASGLAVFDAKGGIKSAGGGVSLTTNGPIKSPPQAMLNTSASWVTLHEAPSSRSAARPTSSRSVLVSATASL